MANIADAEDVYLEARANTEGWKTEFLKQWEAPRVRMYLKMLEKMQPGVLDLIKQSNPDKAVEIDQLTGGPNGNLIR
ncbi:MAG: hypothetical protein ABFD24_06120 [Anaerolineaceae bacterium]